MCIPEIATANDYHPFGMLMPGRNSDSTYRFGFNGKENLDDVKGVGKMQDFGSRIYDSRLGRFLSEDPMLRKVLYISPYIFAGDNPIKFIDENGNFQIDPGIQKNYPIIYKYLSSQIVKDVMNSTTIKDVVQRVNFRRIRH